MNTRHGLGPELGRKPITYTCVCGARSTNYGEIASHIAEETAKAHEPRHLITIPAVGGSEFEIAATPYGDAEDAVEVRLVVRESEGHYRRHMVLVRRDAMPFLIEALQEHHKDLEARRADAQKEDAP